MKRIALALTLIAITTGAVAHFPKIAARLRQMDSNHDQVLSLNEVMIARQERFSALDLNKDRALSADELNKQKLARNPGAKAERLVQRFARLDKNGDRFVSRSEWDARVADLFARFDGNNDRQITREEFRALRARRCR
jgi:EF hand